MKVWEFTSRAKGTRVHIGTRGEKPNIENIYAEFGDSGFFRTTDEKVAETIMNDGSYGKEFILGKTIKKDDIRFGCPFCPVTGKTGEPSQKIITHVRLHHDKNVREKDLRIHTPKTPEKPKNMPTKGVGVAG